MVQARTCSNHLDGKLGALGTALWAGCIERSWVVRQPGSRAVILTDTGREALARDFGVRLETATP